MTASEAVKAARFAENLARSAFKAGWVETEGELDRDAAWQRWWDQYAEEIQTAAAAALAGEDTNV